MRDRGCDRCEAEGQDDADTFCDTAADCGRELVFRTEQDEAPRGAPRVAAAADWGRVVGRERAFDAAADCGRVRLRRTFLDTPSLMALLPSKVFLLSKPEAGSVGLGDLGDGALEL
jgi:hypothetical protein